MVSVDDSFLTSRWAAYWVPSDDHPLWEAGNRWLGRDPGRPGDLRPPARAHVDSPWRYGLHATLKAPMRLADPADVDALVDAMTALAEAHPRAAMPALTVGVVDDFVALVPSVPLGREHPLWQLADDAVTMLDAWRAPPDDRELARQLARAADAAARDRALRWGYPHVLAGWRFHVTLSDGFGTSRRAEQARVLQQARVHFEAALSMPLSLDTLALFREPAPGAPLQLVRRFRLGRR